MSANQSLPEHRQFAEIKPENPRWIKGLNGEIVKFDSITRFWKYYESSSDEWQLWADARPNPTITARGSKTSIDALSKKLSEILNALDLTTEDGRREFKVQVNHIDGEDS